MRRTSLPLLALTGALTFSLLAACAGGQTEPTPTPELASPSASPEVTTPAETPSDPPVSATPTPDEPAAKPVETSAPATTARPGVPSVVPTPTPAPTTVPTDAPAPEASKVQSAWDTISAQVEMPAFADLDGELLSSLYGISSDDLVDYVAKIPLMNVQATEIFLAQVKEGKMDTVKAGIQNRQADLQTEWQQYLPEQLELVENYQLVTQGDYILFCIHPEAGTIVGLFNEAVK